MATNLGDVETKMKAAVRDKTYTLRNMFELPQFVPEYEGKTVSSWLGPAIEATTSTLSKFCNAALSLVPWVNY